MASSKDLVAGWSAGRIRALEAENKELTTEAQLRFEFMETVRKWNPHHGEPGKCWQEHSGNPACGLCRAWREFERKMREAGLKSSTGA